MLDSNNSHLPLSSYRLQFHNHFTFRDATQIIPYLADLGITHVYASPYLRSRPGSTHGYDVIDHCHLNPELGTQADFDAFCAALQKHGMSHILDIVPNHVGVATNENDWWNDVLENGPASIYGNYFDIAWRLSPRPELHDKVLLPILGSGYADALEKRELRLAFEHGSFAVYYFDRRFPISPRTYWRILEHDLPQLTTSLSSDNPDLMEYQSILRAIRFLPDRSETAPSDVAERHREKEVIKRRLDALVDRCEIIRDSIMRSVAAINASADLLDDLLSHQCYRLSVWSVAADEINYRRFFDINDLAALAQERKEVFDATHKLILALVHEGKVTGLRVDHPDGLYDPRQYFERLHDSAPGIHILAEKILAMDEPLPRDWPIHGTTGYDFLAHVNGLFIDSRNEESFTRIYQNFTGIQQSFQDLACENKRLILRTALASDLHMLAHQLDRIAQQDRHWRDFTFLGVLEALRETIASFPVYRSYICSPDVSPRDVEIIETAINHAIARNPGTDPSIFHFIRDALLQRAPTSFTATERADLLRFAGKFQQLTAPVTAKGVEDTSFYCYNRLISLNEVGSDPARFGVSPEQLHAFFLDRQQHWPYALSALSTHDTKRSEDVRARINVLSEIPDEWSDCVNRWHDITRGYRGPVDPNDQYLLYQTLIGAWPDSDAPDAAFTQRIQCYMNKAIREAKRHTSWTAPDAAYESAVAIFVEKIIADPAFRSDFIPLAGRVAKLGIINSLAQTLLKLTAPGIPDTYQGTELFDFSLVDPDNRRPVDYERRAQQLASLSASVGATPASPSCLPLPVPGERAGERGGLTERKTKDSLKLLITTKLLHLRRQNPTLLTTGDYIPLKAHGPAQDKIFAFARKDESKYAITIIPRLAATPADWSNTTVEIPDAPAPLTNLFTGAVIHQFPIPMQGLFTAFPVALLHW